MATDEALSLLCVVYVRSSLEAVTRRSMLAAMAWLGVYTVSTQHLTSSYMDYEH
jgi:hypothetical protein